MARFILLFVLFFVLARTFWRFVDAILRGVAGPASAPGRPSGQRPGPFDSGQGRPFDSARGKPFDSAQGKPFDSAQGKQAAVKMSPCPVCGTYVVPGKAISIVSGGSPVYFDSEKCRAEYQSR